MQKLLEALFQKAPDLSPKLKLAARLVLDKPNLVATTSMRALARRAGVAPPTMIRLARELGFDNYESFKQVFQASINDQKFDNKAGWLNLENRASWLQQQSDEISGIASIVSELADSGHDNIQDLYQNLDLEMVCKAADMIINAPVVYVVSAGAAHWMAAYLQYVGKMAVPNLRVPRTSGNGLIEGLIPINSGDVILTMAYNPYSKQSIDASKFAISRGARMIYLTDSKAAPLASEAEVLMLQKTDSPQFYPSMVSVVSALETLIAVVVARSGERAIAAISDYVEIRKNDDY